MAWPATKVTCSNAASVEVIENSLLIFLLSYRFVWTKWWRKLFLLLFIDVDENGNPFAGSATINGPSSNPLLHSRSSSSMLNPINTTIVTHSSASSSSTATTTLAGGPKATSRPKGKKKSKDGNVLVIEDLPGFVGNKVSLSAVANSISPLLTYILRV